MLLISQFGLAEKKERTGRKLRKERKKCVRLSLLLFALLPTH